MQQHDDLGALAEAIEVAALHAVLHPDDEAWLRHIQRWYSTRFHTPLHQVPDLNVEDVLQAYFEECFEEMEEEVLDEHRERLLLPPSERKKLDQVASLKDEEFLKNLEAEVTAGMKGPPREKKADPARLKAELKGPPPALAALAAKIQRVKKAVDKSQTSLPGPKQPAQPPPDDLPEIHMDFGGGFDLDLDPLAPPPKRH